jgi:hypothetical protein
VPGASAERAGLDGAAAPVASATEVGDGLGLAVDDGLGDGRADPTGGDGDESVREGVGAEQLTAAISRTARKGKDRRIGHTAAQVPRPV